MHAPTEPDAPADNHQPEPVTETAEVTQAEPGHTNHDDTHADSPETGSPDELRGQRLMIAVADLAAHPGNVRADLALTQEFTASITAEGVRIPLLVTAGPDSTWRVIEGHRRLAAAIAAGLSEVPCDIDPGRAGDEAGQYLDMALANSDAYRSKLPARRGSSSTVRSPRGRRHPDPHPQGHRPHCLPDQDRTRGGQPVRRDQGPGHHRGDGRDAGRPGAAGGVRRRR